MKTGLVIILYLWFMNAAVHAACVSMSADSDMEGTAIVDLPDSARSHELSLMNVKRVAEEAGLCNILFVLAQSVLETGNYTSRICREYNNLFGLYDSRHGDYYRFARWEDSVIAYKKYIQYRYKGGNYLHFLKSIGYATDPEYTRKVAMVARDLYVRYFRNKY